MNVDITIPAQSVTIPSQDVTATIPAAQIVYQNSWLNQTASILATDIFTPSGEGIFRATAAAFAYGTTNCGVDGNISYPAISEDFGSSYRPTGSPPQQNTPAEFAFGGTAGVPVVISANPTNVTYYDLFVTIEQLQ
jgi:hypothetical protein